MNAIQSFFHKGGYAMYVWPSFGLSLFVLLANVWFVRWEYKRAVRDTARRVATQAKK